MIPVADDEGWKPFIIDAQHDTSFAVHIPDGSSRLAGNADRDPGYVVLIFEV
jgi:hypothetical protein